MSSCVRQYRHLAAQPFLTPAADATDVRSLAVHLFHRLGGPLVGGAEPGEHVHERAPASGLLGGVAGAECEGAVDRMRGSTWMAETRSLPGHAGNSSDSRGTEIWAWPCSGMGAQWERVLLRGAPTCFKRSPMRLLTCVDRC